jgi:hypothetical protein
MQVLKRLLGLLVADKRCSHGVFAFELVVKSDDHCFQTCHLSVVKTSRIIETQVNTTVLVPILIAGHCTPTANPY